jgi:hypothetical protein
LALAFAERFGLKVLLQPEYVGKTAWHDPSIAGWRLGDIGSPPAASECDARVQQLDAVEEGAIRDRQGARHGEPAARLPSTAHADEMPIRGAKDITSQREESFAELVAVGRQVEELRQATREGPGSSDTGLGAAGILGA